MPDLPDQRPDRPTAEPTPGGLTRARRSPAGGLAGLAVVAVLLAFLVGAGALAMGAGSSAPGATPPTQATSEAARSSPSASSEPATPSKAGESLASGVPGPAESGELPSPAPPAAESPAPSPSVSPIPAARLQKKLEAMTLRASLPGVSVALVWDDGRTWTGTAGYADVAAERPVTADSGFALASISKTFTAAVVLQLVDEGRLALDQPVAPLLPGYGLDKRITLRMLLDHTSGLADFFFNPRIDALLQGDPGAAWTAQRSWSMVPKPVAKPGKRWSYSNTNYLLLGKVVEAVTGNSLAHEVRSRLLDPLALGQSWYQAKEKPLADITTGYRLITTKNGEVKARAVAPASGVMPFRSVVTAAGGAGSIASTALDTARWMQAFAGGRVLSPAMQQAMLADVARTEARHATIPYGLGIQEVTMLGRTALGHSGRYLGFRNVVRYLPADGVAIAVLTNQGGYDPARIAKAMLKIVLPATPVAEPSPGSSASAGSSPAPGASPVPGATGATAASTSG